MADESLPPDSNSERLDSGSDDGSPSPYQVPSPTPEPEEEEGGPVKSFLEHLEDLRWVLIKIISSILVSMTICMVATPQIVQFLTWPKDQTETGRKVSLTYIDPLAPFTSMMKIAFWGGLI